MLDAVKTIQPVDVPSQELKAQMATKKAREYSRCVSRVCHKSDVNQAIGGFLIGVPQFLGAANGDRQLLWSAWSASCSSMTIKSSFSRHVVTLHVISRLARQRAYWLSRVLTA